MRIFTSIIMSLVLLVLGWVSHSWFFDFSLEQLEPHNVEFQNTSLISFNPLMYAIALGSIPLFHLLVRNLVTLKSSAQSIFIYAFMILSGVLVWWFRTYQLHYKFQSAYQLDLGRNVIHTYNVDELYFDLFLLVGVILGAFASFVVLILNNEPQKKASAEDLDNL